METPAPTKNAMNDETAQALVRRCPVGLSLHGEHGEFCAASDECAHLFGRPRDDLLHTSLAVLVDSRDLDRFRTEWAAAAICGRDTTLRYRLAAPPDAATTWVETELRVETVETGPAATHPKIACASRRVQAADSAAANAWRAERDGLELARRHRDILVEMLPALVWFGPVTADLQGYRLSYLSNYLFSITGYRQEEWFGTPGFWRGCIHPDDLEETLAATEQMMRGERAQGPVYRLRARNGQYLRLQSSMYIERDAAGVPVRMYGVTLDVTEHFATRERNAELQLELVERATRILELSAPVIPLADDALIMPLIGAIDQTRADHAIDVLLTIVRERRARRVILDLTGVHSVDAQSVAVLVRAAGSVRMLGARPMLTGLRPEIALVIVELGLSLVGLEIYRSIPDALRDR